ncbi:hypothetical protein L1F28_32695 [Arthrospira platensis NCB002]|uniref:hypothetical protein n=1 Tax=Limnospira platensis TaxID=118562 RepID=UPI0001D0EDF2|nr:hypothetical protein [Arthrospira platensis NCB002]BAI91653.1 hypothetical protein NIES39_K00030 [Arthrospira platensis NIES-39]BDT13986.1 hypothetical protein N39L_37090 [Arthrospira platensis NIES-39]
MSNVVGIDQKELTSTAIAGGAMSAQWFNSFSSTFYQQVQNLKAFDFKKWAGSVKGGALAIAENIKKGNWGFFKDWLLEAPMVPKVAGLLAGGLIAGTVLVIGGKAVGLVAAGAGGVISAHPAFVGGFLGVTVPTLMSKLTQGVSQAYNFDWAASDKKMMDELKQAANALYVPLGETVGKSLAALVAGKVGSAAATSLRIREGAIAAMCMINPTIKETLVDALSSLRYAVQEVVKKALFVMTYINARKVAAKLLDKEDTWGKEGQSPFIVSEKVEETWAKVKEDEYFDWVNEQQWEGIETMTSTFFETLGELLSEQGTYEEWIPV